jgi:predicted 3-demethylubiquinone-9 3-methyltransferase (glyoxalase superfamily)
MQKITPCLWFDNNAEEAVQFYTSTFKDSKIQNVSYYTEEGPMPAGTVLTISFLLYGQEFLALNGGPVFKFSQAISFVINCDTQEEIDYLWDNLSAGGETQQCGWLIDKFGVTWQIVPRVLDEYMLDKNPNKVRSVTRAMLQMVKLDIAQLKQAYDQG